jgi:DNA-binding transcriptional regulator YhcF (GntR family)
VIIAVDPTQPLPVYEQIREQIVRMVAAGTMTEGTQLPTIRQLAHDLGLAKGTVAKAYELLEGEAIIETLGRKGSFVRPSTPTPALERRTGLAEAADSLVVIARQLDAGEDAVIDAVRAAWKRF